MKSRFFKALGLCLISLLLALSLFSCDQLSDISDDSTVDSYELYSYAKTRFAGEIATGDTFSITVDCTYDGDAEKIVLNCVGQNFNVTITDKEDNSLLYYCAFIDNTVYYSGANGNILSLPLSRENALALLENTPAFKKYFPVLAFELPTEWFTASVKLDKKNKQYELDLELTALLCGYLPEDVDFFANGSKLKFLFNKDKTIKKLEMKKVYINDARCDVTVKFDWDKGEVLPPPSANS